MGEGRTMTVTPFRKPTIPASAYCTIDPDMRAAFHTLAALVSSAGRTFSGSATRTDQLDFTRAQMGCIATLAKQIEKGLS